ncbi:MAG TPA: hypothetical protein VEA69_10810 [Tepidisphaeraceae bacterium]|nr:hypothetical protein [Tepidisphaeraceae bacterium]
MTRETRNNLIFLSIFLAISIPGAVILFKKKLDPNAGRMSMPDPVNKRIAFMAPLSRPGENPPRIVPDQTGAWLDELTLRRAGSPMLLVTHRPVISEDRRVQLADVKKGADGTTLSLIVWAVESDAAADRYSIELAPTRVISVARAEPEEIPANVRKELVSHGYQKPPLRVVWLSATVPAEVFKGAGEVTVAFREPASAGWRSVVKLP